MQTLSPVDWCDAFDESPFSHDQLRRVGRSVGLWGALSEAPSLQPPAHALPIPVVLFAEEGLQARFLLPDDAPQIEQ